MTRVYFLVLLLMLTVSAVIVEQNGSNDDNATGKPVPVFCLPSFDTGKLNEGNAPIFSGLGNLHYPVTTRSATAQKYFNQGLTLIYAFNHGEAGRSFKAALKHDSMFAMAYWGMGMVLGPNYNAALDPSILGLINDMMHKANKFSEKGTEKEKMLIEALTARFPFEKVEDMSPYNRAYADKMKAVYDRYPDDPEVAALYADALMNEHPWDLWMKDGKAQPWTQTIITVLEKSIRDFPKHPGSNHLYIHAVEASREATKGLPSADLLSDLLPSAGHLVHMPSHIYIRTGHYHKGVLVNEKASLADSTYISQCKVQGSYPLYLYPHNIHFLAACAFLEGNSKKAMEAAFRAASVADPKYLFDDITIQHFYSIPFFVMVHLAKWDDILKAQDPGGDLKYPSAIFHYAKGMAYATKGNSKEAKSELQTLIRISKDESLKNARIWGTNAAIDIVNIAINLLFAEIATRSGDYNTAINLLVKAIEIEDALVYQEPPDWFFSVRHSLGHVLLEAKQFEAAENVYREDLVTFPENGWALMGLYQSLKNQGKKEADTVKKRFDKAWQWADIVIESSRKF